MNKERIGDLICSAFEGGSNYWCAIKEYQKPEHLNFRYSEDNIYRHIDYPLNEGGAVICSDVDNSDILFVSTEDEDSNSLVFDWEACKRGLRVLRAKYPWHYYNWIKGNDDAETADAFLQCAIFGEIVFG